MNSWLPWMRCPLLSATARAIETASVRASKATAIAIGTSFSIVPMEKSGLDSGGRPTRKAPMLLMPVFSAPKIRFSSAASSPPMTRAAIMCGARGRHLRMPTLAATVTSATTVTCGLMSASCRHSPCSTSQTEEPRAISMPKKFLTWLAAISTAAPAVKPTTTVCDTKLTRVPSRSAPSASWNTPTRKVSVSTRPTNSGEPGSANGLMVAKTTIDIAVVGPDTRCHDEPHKAATTAGNMAAYKPYSGGMPAMVANATPWGTSTRPPVRPAMASARSVTRSTMCRHCRKGNRCSNQVKADRRLISCSGVSLPSCRGRRGRYRRNTGGMRR